jgi:hypothetical protein
MSHGDRRLVHSSRRMPRHHAARALVAAITALFVSAPGIARAVKSEAAAPAKDVPSPNAILTRACSFLASNQAFSFHADILFDQLLPSAVKVQFAAAMDFALQRPNELAVYYESDLGEKRLWYSGDRLTIYDPPHEVYAVTSVPETSDGALEYVAETRNLTIPLGVLAASNPCGKIRPQIRYSGYIGVNNVNGRACDHVAFSSKDIDFQLWVDKTGKPILRKVVINYRAQPGSPEFIAFLSDWKFPATIPASSFQPRLPKSANRIDFLQVKPEGKP